MTEHSPLPLTFQTVIPIGYDVVPYIELLDANGVGIAGLGWADAAEKPLPMNENAHLIVNAVNERPALVAEIALLREAVEAFIFAASKGTDYALLAAVTKARATLAALATQKAEAVRDD